MFKYIFSVIFNVRRGSGLLNKYKYEDLYNDFKKCDTQKDTRIWSLFSYKDKNVKACIWEMKYYNNKKAYELFAYALFRYINYAFPSRPIPTHITNVPISQRRKNEKGFDHIHRLCTEITKISGGTIYYKPLCQKIQHTSRQAHIKERCLRLKNIKGSFTVESEVVIPPAVIIIDDVYTTGSTLSELHRIIQTAGSQKIICLTIAH